MDSIGITAIPGIRVGHYTDLDAGTGCTVILCQAGAVGAVDVRGASPGTRETDLLQPANLVSEVHAIVLSGGSAFGLDTASGVMRYLEERSVGIRVAGSLIPIVPAAILFDLSVLSKDVRPGATEGYSACVASSQNPAEEGSVGAGTGATVGKLLGIGRGMKGGIGTASVELSHGITVGAIVAVNAIGGVYDPRNGEKIAGPRDEHDSICDSIEILTESKFQQPKETPMANTTIGVVATNATLDKAQSNKLASVSQNGLAITLRPAHTMSDGDAMFAISTGAVKQKISLDKICAAAVLCVSRAIIRGVMKATGIGNIPSVTELNNCGSQ